MYIIQEIYAFIVLPAVKTHCASIIIQLVWNPHLQSGEKELLFQILDSVIGHH
jgi:hypothetical protein